MFRYEANEGAKGVERVDGIGFAIWGTCLIRTTFGFEECGNFLYHVRIRKE